MKKNYTTWHINTKAFSNAWPDEQKLQYFARFAILAPSGHNTQPWHFDFQKDQVSISANKSRHLYYSGIQAAEPFVSLGACLQTMQLAASGYGYNLEITYNFSGRAIAVAKISGKIKSSSSLLSAIKQRVSNRHSYRTDAISRQILSSFFKSRYKGVTCQVVSNKQDIAYIAKLTAIATITIMSDKSFRVELSKWVRNNLTKQHDGMPGFVQGMPTPPSLLAKHVIKNINISKSQAKKDAQRVLHSANLIIIMVNDKKKQTLLEAGRQYADICILAQQQGFATSGVGAAAIDPETNSRISKHFQLNDYPLAIIRIGKTSKAARHTPRWHLEDVSNIN